MADRPSRIFGVVTSLSGFTGLIANSYSENSSVDVAEARDEKRRAVRFGPILQVKRTWNGSTCNN